MITLRCTRALRKRLRLPERLPDTPPATTALGNWYVHLLRFGHNQLVIATSERSLLTVLLPAKDLRTTLLPNLQAALRALLEGLWVAADLIDREIEAMTAANFGCATNRRVLGSMNDFAFQASVHLAAGQDARSIALRLAETPMSAIGPRRGHLGYPCDVARDLLGASVA